jgi:hypothetical protein
MLKKIFFLVGLGFELRVLGLKAGALKAGTLPPVHFALVILEIWSLKLFAQAGLEPCSSLFQPSK